MQKADQHQNRDRLQDVIEDLESQAASTTTSTNVPNGLTASTATSAGKKRIRNIGLFAVMTGLMYGVCPSSRILSIICFEKLQLKVRMRIQRGRGSVGRQKTGKAPDQRQPFPRTSFSASYFQDVETRAQPFEPKPLTPWPRLQQQITGPWPKSLPKYSRMIRVRGARSAVMMGKFPFSLLISRTSVVIVPQKQDTLHLRLPSKNYGTLGVYSL